MGPDDLQLLLVRKSNDKLDLLIYDPMPGGSGLLEQMLDRWQELVATAKELLVGCVQGCETACYACLKTFRNQFHHELLNRHEALKLMTDLDRTPEAFRDIVPVFEEEKPGAGTPSNQPEARLLRLLQDHQFPAGSCRKRVVTSAGLPTEPDWLNEETKVAVYLDGMSRGLHGDPKTAQRDQLIRGMLELDGYTVIVVQSRDLDDPQAVRLHLKNIAQAMGRADLAESVGSGNPDHSSPTRHDASGAIPPDPSILERRLKGDEALSYCDERCRALVRACIDHDRPLPEVGFELQDESGRVCSDAELAWPSRALAVLLPDRLDAAEAFRDQGWTVLVAGEVTEERLLDLLPE
jgi:hypothetical protein